MKDKGERSNARKEAKAAAVTAKAVAEATGAITKQIIPEAQLSPSVITRKMNEIVASRGRRPWSPSIGVELAYEIVPLVLRL